MERLWAETGMGRDALQAQEVELEAEAEAVVMFGPRSVLLPSASRNQGVSVGSQKDQLFTEAFMH